MPRTDARRLRVAVVVVFLNEAGFLPRLLASLADQTRPPDEVLLIDDGSSDGSAELAEAFCAEHGSATLHRRPQRAKETDRLGQAAELRAFLWGVECSTVEWDVVTKLDADLDLGPAFVETVMGHLEADPGLGVAGAFLYEERGGGLERDEHRDSHVRGATKFYRRTCFEDIQPLLPILGWDEFDEVKARMAGWRTRSFDHPGRPSIHLRPTGMYDGRLRAYRRWGQCYWGFGMSAPAMVLLALWRLRHRPHGLASAHLLYGYVRSALDRRPRVEPEVRRFRRKEQRQRALKALGRRQGPENV